jgi:hypothetical protein
MDQNEILHDPCHLGVLSGVSKWFPSLWYVWRKPCTYHAPKLTLSPKGPKGDSTWPTSHRSSIGCVQNDFWGYGKFGANCGSFLHRDKHYLQMDRNENQHDPRHLRVLSGASKWFPSLQYVWRNPCTYHAPKLTLSPKGLKGDSTCPTSPRSSIGYIQNNFWADGAYGANHATIMHRN